MSNLRTENREQCNSLICLERKWWTDIPLLTHASIRDICIFAKATENRGTSERDLEYFEPYDRAGQLAADIFFQEDLTLYDGQWLLGFCSHVFYAFFYIPFL